MPLTHNIIKLDKLPSYTRAYAVVRQISSRTGVHGIFLDFIEESAE